MADHALERRRAEGHVVLGELRFVVGELRGQFGWKLGRQFEWKLRRQRVVLTSNW